MSSNSTSTKLPQPTLSRATSLPDLNRSSDPHHAAGSRLSRVSDSSRIASAEAKELHQRRKGRVRLEYCSKDPLAVHPIRFMLDAKQSTRTEIFIEMRLLVDRRRQLPGPTQRIVRTAL